VGYAPRVDPVLLLAIAGAIAGGVAMAAKDRRRRKAILRAAAARIGARFDYPRIVGTLDGVDFMVQLESTSRAQHMVWRSYVPDGVPVFHLYPRTSLDLDHILFGSEVTLRWPEFARHFMVRTRDPAPVHRLWSRDVLQKLVETFPAAELRGSGDTLVLRVPYLAASVDEVEKGIEVVVALAKADAFGIAALRGLPEAAYHAGSPSLVTIAGPERIRIGPMQRDGFTTTCLLANPIDTVWVIPIRHGTASDPALERVPAELRTLVKKLESADVMSSSDAFEIRWRSIETDHEHLLAGVELVRGLSQGLSLGVFR
jgi:hypothetical protein